MFPCVCSLLVPLCLSNRLRNFSSDSHEGCQQPFRMSGGKSGHFASVKAPETQWGLLFRWSYEILERVIAKPGSNDVLVLDSPASSSLLQSHLHPKKYTLVNWETIWTRLPLMFCIIRSGGLIESYSSAGIGYPDTLMHLGQVQASPTADSDQTFLGTMYIFLCNYQHQLTDEHC